MKLKLITKYSIVTSAVLVLTMTIFAAINIKTIERSFLLEAIHHSDDLSETLLRTTHYHMLEDNRKRVYQMIQEVGSQHGIEHIRLIKKDGEISFSTHPLEIGTLVDKNTEACNMCHGRNIPRTHASTMNRSRIFVDRDGKEVIGIANGIYNEPACYTAACHVHSKDVKLLGVLDVTVSLEQVTAMGTLYRNSTIIFTVFLLLLTSLCLSLLTHSLVNKPLKKLLKHTQQLTLGNLDTRIRNAPKDELGDLYEAFNQMAQSLQQNQHELKVWAATLESKVEQRTREIKKMQSKLVRSEKLASLGELVAGIAHEINNPLTGILMYSSMIRSDSRIDSDLHEDLDIIIQETQRCALIVKDLLDFSRESKMEKAPVPLTTIMEKTLALLSPQASFDDIQIVRKYAQDIPTIPVDPNQIEQVFMNLLINASQAMAGKGSLTIETGQTENPAGVFVKISDTGCGIPPENLAKIFDPFFTTKEHVGTGLGLSVSYGIIQHHGGTIEVESQVGSGTTFIITLSMPAPATEPMQALPAPSGSP